MKQSKFKFLKFSILSAMFLIFGAMIFSFNQNFKAAFAGSSTMLTDSLAGSTFMSEDLSPTSTAPTAITLENGDYRTQSEYLDFYSVSTSSFSFSNNGGEVANNELSKAFDRDFNTCFKSAQDNNVNLVDKDTNQVISTNFLNHIDISFNQTVNIDRILYGSENGITRGYPTELNIYSFAGGNWTQICNIKSTETLNLVVFDLGSTYAVNQLRFEYVKVPTYHKYQPTAREIIFLQPESDLFEDYSNLFLDYTQTRLNSKFSTFEKVVELENNLKQNINYALTKSKLERAKQVAANKVNFVPQREFSTNKNAQNVINQYGNIASYCRNDLQLNAFGTNRQATGVLGYAGEQITVYVDAEPTDPLPKIRFTQHIGYWNSWRTGELQLSLGKNTFTVPNFKNANYSIDVALGGPIYICNPYTSDEQSQNVKIYFEGGDLYPVLTKETDIKAYKLQLSEYTQKVEANPSEVIDLTEIVTDHAILTVTATKANEIYSNFNPSQTIANWNSFMDQLLEFDGITQDETDALFDERNLHINVNIRVVQPWPSAGAYAYDEHVGVYHSWQTGLITGSNIGWGIPHEIGHMMDNPNRTIGETSNNMFAKYNEIVIEKANYRFGFDDTLTTLSNDLIYNKESFFNHNRYNYLVWWHIECWQKGYWANLENCYRGKNATLKQFLALDSTTQAKINSLGKTEKQVLFSSLVTGVDMSYYFDRWGFTIANDEKTDPVFKIASASQTFKELMALASSNAFVDNTVQPKLWYQTSTAYHNLNRTQIYDSSTQPNIKSVTKTTSGYNIFIDHKNNPNHLGYEIWQGDETNGYKQIGFSYSSAFTDTNEYAEGYVPSYKVVAVDNTFSSSQFSEAATVQTSSTAVCKIGNVEYNSLIKAIDAAQAGDTILLLKSFSTVNLTVSKNLTIRAADDVKESITISKIEAGDFITVAAGVTLNLLGTNSYSLILNGNGFSQNGTLLGVSGVVKAQYVDFKNNVSTGDGGAIVLQNNSKNSTFENCKITSNKAQNGSAIYCNFANAQATFFNTIISNNSTTNNGVISFKCNLTFNGCDIKDNKSKNGTIMNFAGGILSLNNCVVTCNTAEVGAGLYIDGYTTVKFTEISFNSASKQAGGIYYSTNIAVRRLVLEDSTIFSNTAPSDGDILVLSGNFSIKSTVIGSDTQSGNISIFGGTTTIFSSSDIQAQINLKNGANLVLDGGIFVHLSACTFNLLDFSDEMIILKSNNYQFTQSDCDNINLDSSCVHAELLDGTIVGKATDIVLTLNFGDEQQTKTCKYGEVVRLNFDPLTTQYAESFVDLLGNEFDFGSSVVVISDLTLTARLSNKVKVDFNFGSDTISEYYIPYTMVDLPQKSASEQTQNQKLIAWGNADKMYAIGTRFAAVSNTSFDAIYERLFLLTLKNKGEVVFSEYFEYGTEVDLKQVYPHQNLSYWSNNGVKIDGDKITINGDITLDAMHTAKEYIVPILTASFVLLFALSITIFILIKTHKSKQNK